MPAPPLPVPPAPPAPRLAQPGPPAPARAWKAAQEFEAMALGQLLAPIFATLDGAAQGPFGGGQGEQMWRGMLAQELGRHIAAHGGVGLAAPVYRQILRLQEAAATMPAPPGQEETPP